MSEREWHKDGDDWHYPIPFSTDEARVYIVPTKEKPCRWRIVNISREHMEAGWIRQVEQGGGTTIAGPFDTLEAAKAAWFLIYGRGIHEGMAFAVTA